MPTGLAILDELEKWGILLKRGTATAVGAVNYITDIEHLDSDLISSTMFNGCFVRLTSEAGSVNARSGSQAHVDYVDNINGRLYYSPSFISGSTNAIPQSAQTYHVWRPGLDPDDVDLARDEALTRLCSQWAKQPLTEVTNGDYEAGAVGSTPTGWTNDAGGAGTASKTDLVPPTQFLRQSILLTNGAANGRATSSSIYVQPNRSFYLYVPVSARSGTAELVVRDVTNGANISLSGTAVTATGRGWTAFEVTGQIPSGCFEIQIWLRGQEASAVVEWGTVNFHWQNQTRIGLPVRITTTKWVSSVYVAQSYMTRSSASWGTETFDEIQDTISKQVAGSVEIQIPDGMGNAPYFFEERVFYAALQTDYQTAAQRRTGFAATTNCPTNYAVAALVKVLAEQYILKQSGEQEFWALALAHAKDELDLSERDYGPETKPHIELAKQYFVPEVRI